MSNVIFDEELAVQMVKKVEAHTENVAAFNKAGVNSIRECGVSGGDQGRRINELADTIEEKSKEAVKGNEALIEGIRTILENNMQFNYQSLVNKAKESTENIKKGIEVQTRKKSYS